MNKYACKSYIYIYNEHNITNIIAINKQKEKLSPKKVPNGVVILSYSTSR